MDRLLNEFIEEIKTFGQRKAAKLSGIKECTIRKWCRKTSIPTLIKAQKVANAMGLEFLLFDKE